MRYVVGVIGTVVSVGLIIVSVMMNIRFGQMLGKTEFDGMIYGLASGCADGFKVVLPFAALWAWRNARYIASTLSILLLTLFACWSLASSLGFSATNRAETSGVRHKIVREYQDARTHYRQAMQRREGLGTFRPAGTVDSLIRAKQQHPRWTSTRACTDATVAASRRFCDAYFRLQAERGTAIQAARLDRRIATLQNRLASYQGGALTQGQTDPQIAIIKHLSGLATNRIELALSMMLSLMVELGSGFGLFVTFGHGQGAKQAGGRVRHETASPLLLEQATMHDEDWAQQQLQQVSGCQVGATELYSHYRDWCQHNQVRQRRTQSELEEWLVSCGVAKMEQQQGKHYYVGIRLKKDNDILAYSSPNNNTSSKVGDGR